MTDLSPDTTPELARGWTPERKTQFLDYLSEKGNVRTACSRVGLSREAAYRLRRRDPVFARGWAAALVLAHEASVEVLADRAIDGIEEDVWHRGEQVGTRRKYDNRLLLAHIARLDKLVEEQPAAAKDAARFDELLACVAGETVRWELRSRDNVLPLDREEAMREMAAMSEDAVRYAEPKDDESANPAVVDAKAEEEACIDAFRRGRLAGAAMWDAWFEDACGYVDWLSGWDDGVPVEPMWAGPEGEEAIDAVFDPRTVSNVSTGCDSADRDAGEPYEDPPA